MLRAIGLEPSTGCFAVVGAGVVMIRAFEDPIGCFCRARSLAVKPAVPAGLADRRSKECLDSEGAE
jgi:hypothetical protein